MELRQLRYFVAVAEELHFTRAAQRMHVAQPALSAQIRALEREVGGPLLDRTTRNVQLTDAGRDLVAQAAEVIQLADRALASVKQTARRDGQTLAVGCLGAPGDLLYDALDVLAERHPDRVVNVQTFDYVEMWSALYTEEVDLVLAHLPFDAPRLEGLDALPLVDEPRVVVLSTAHPLADRDELRPADLADEVFITNPGEVPERWRNFWLLTDQLGRRPAIHGVTAENVYRWLHLIQRGHGIDTCPEYVARYYAWPTLRYIPLADAPPATVAVLSRHRSGGPSRSVEEFAGAVLEAAAAHPTLSRHRTAEVPSLS